MRLYRAPFSTNVERVALALAHKGLEVESIWIEYTDRSVVERVSGQGLVPVIEADDGEVLFESMDIVRWLEKHHPEPPLYPGDPARHAELLVFVEWFNRVWKGPPNEIEEELGNDPPDEARIASLSAQMNSWLGLFESMLEGRDYLMNDRFSAADCCAFPFLKYALMREEEDDELFHIVLDEHQHLGDDHPGLEAWINRVNERPRA